MVRMVAAVCALATCLPGATAADQSLGERVFGAPAGLIFNSVKPDKTGDFELVLARVKEALARSARDERRLQAAGWRVYRAVEPGPAGTVVYVFVVDPTVPKADYRITKILAEELPAESDALYQKLADASVAAQSIVNLQPITDFGRPGPLVVPR